MWTSEKASLHTSGRSVRSGATLQGFCYLWRMSEGTSSGEENANLYMRGVNEGRAGEILDGETLLEILDFFGEDGIRAYIMGHVEGVAEAMEDEHS
jgi:hypothetical protein